MRGVLSGQVVFLFRRQFFLLIESIPPGQPADQGADARYEEPEHSDNQSNHSENNVAVAVVPPVEGIGASIKTVLLNDYFVKQPKRKNL